MRHCIKVSTLPILLISCKIIKLKQLAIEIAYQNLSEESSEREVADLLHVIALSSIAEAIEQKKIQQQEAKRVGNQQLEAELTMEIIQLARQLKAQRTFT